MALDGKVGAIVTNPINKSVLKNPKFAFPGHTEFLASLAGVKSTPIMMLATDNLKVVPVTIHQSLRDAIETLDIDKIIEAGIVTNNALKKNFGLPHPKLAVAGLNPHAGENNSMGNEESLNRTSCEGIEQTRNRCLWSSPSRYVVHQEIKRKF